MSRSRSFSFVFHSFCGVLSPAGTVLAAVQEYYDFPPTSAARRGSWCPTYHLRSTCTSRDFYSAITGG